MKLAVRLLWLRRLGVLSVALTVLLMTLGAWVKANGAGLSCPDWPTCYGEWLPPFPSSQNGGVWDTDGDGVAEPVAFTQALILYEWAHRFVASIVGAVVLAFAIVAARGKEFAAPTRQLPAMAFALVLFQAGLGAITVLTGNPPWATTAHLVTAVAFLLVLTVATCYATLRPLPIDAATNKPAEPAKPRKIDYVYPDETPAPAEAPSQHGH